MMNYISRAKVEQLNNLHAGYPIITCCLRCLREICLKLCGLSTERTQPILMSTVVDPDICFKAAQARQ
jgi:hypothetical protein